MKRWLSIAAGYVLARLALFGFRVAARVVPVPKEEEADPFREREVSTPTGPWICWRGLVLGYAAPLADGTWLWGARSGLIRLESKSRTRDDAMARAALAMNRLEHTAIQ